MRYLTGLLSLFLLTASFGTASAEGQLGSAGTEYVFILGARGNPYWQALADGITDTAKALHRKALIYQLQNENAAEEQLNICLSAITRHPKVIAMTGVSPSVEVQCFKAAMAEGILVADVDAHLLPDAAKEAGIHLLFSVGSDNFQIGENAALYASHIATKPDLRILVIEGDPGNLNSQKRVNGFVKQLKKSLPKAVIVASITAGWDRLRAMNITNDLLLREPALDLIYAANDGMALGAAEGLRSNDRTAVSVIGVDGVADARAAILNGKLTATVAQLPYLIGKRAVELIESPPTDPLVIVEAPVLDKKILTDGTANFIQFLR